MTRSFLGFKRNQVQEAIAAVLKPASRQQATEMLGRVKRLLDTDRAHGRNKRASDPEKANFAFRRDGMPGRGYENIFSEFDAFALLVALRLMGFGLPQGAVVSLLRRLRPQLERQHRQIVRLAAAAPLAEQQIPHQAKSGDLAFDATDPRFIVIVWEGDRRGSRSVALCQGQREVFELFHRYGPGYAFTLLELVTSALVLSSALAQTKPRTRGRAPK
jgi:hypothetical protein